VKTLRSERIQGSKKCDGNAQFSSCCTSTKCRPEYLFGPAFSFVPVVMSSEVETSLTISDWGSNQEPKNSGETGTIICRFTTRGGKHADCSALPLCIERTRKHGFQPILLWRPGRANLRCCPARTPGQRAGNRCGLPHARRKKR
jgi:hypothetical protein